MQASAAPHRWHSRSRSSAAPSSRWSRAPRARDRTSLTQPVTVAAVGQYFSGGVLPNAPVVWQVTIELDDVLAAELVAVHLRRHRGRTGWTTSARGGFGRCSQFVRGLGDGIGGPPCCFPQPEQKAVTYTGRHRHDRHPLPAAQLRRREARLAGDGLCERLGHRREPPELRVEPRAPGASVDALRRHSQRTRQFVREGEPIDVEAIVTDIDGKAVAGRTFTITVTRVESRFENGTWVDTDVDPKTLRGDVVEQAGVVFRSRPASAASTRSPPSSPTTPAARTAASSRAG